MIYNFFKYKNNFQKSISFVLLLSIYTFVLPVLGHAQSIDAKLMINKQAGGEISFDVQSNEIYAVYAIINFVSLKGLDIVKKSTEDYLKPQTKQSTVAVVQVLPGKTIGILLLQPRQDATVSSYSVSYRFVFTDPTKNKRDDFAYYLPFEHGLRHVITQGWFGKYSHTGQNEYAVDFDLLEGEKIYAARGGKVVAIKEDSKVGGTSTRFSRLANYVLVLHSDNTIASYVHLQFNGAYPNVGDEIKVGDFIGYAGSTGFANGPHLHFDLRESSLTADLKSIPFNFRDKDGNPVRPQTNKGYYGRFPNKKDFVEIDIKNIVAERYKDYTAAVPKEVNTNTLHIRKESYDDVIVLFISNTFTQDVSAKVHLILKNAKPTAAQPIKVRIPMQKEIFLGIVKIMNMDNSFAVKTKINYIFD